MWKSQTPGEDIEEVDLVMIRSRMCPEECVEEDICCFRKKVSRRVLKEVE